MTRVQLRESAGQIVAENLVVNGEGVKIHCGYTPGLIINPRYWTNFLVTSRSRRTNACRRANFLDIFCEIKHRVAPRRPSGHLQVEPLHAGALRQLDFNCYFEQV